MSMSTEQLDRQTAAHIYINAFMRGEVIHTGSNFAKDDGSIEVNIDQQTQTLYLPFVKYGTPIIIERGTKAWLYWSQRETLLI